MLSDSTFNKIMDNGKFTLKYKYKTLSELKNGQFDTDIIFDFNNEVNLHLPKRDSNIPYELEKFFLSQKQLTDTMIGSYSSVDFEAFLEARHKLLASSEGIIKKFGREIEF